MAAAQSGTWSTVTTAGKAVDCYDPASGRPRFGILFLHGVGLTTLLGKTAFTDCFDELRLACCCPHGQRSWWTDRVCTEFDPALSAERFLLENVVPLFGSRWGLAPPAIGLLGISMGGQGALRLAFKQPKRFPAVAAIAAAIDYYDLYGQGSPLDEMYDSKEQCRQDTAPLHLPPYNPPPHIWYAIDPDDRAWLRGNDRLHEKMNALGVAHEFDCTTRAGGHSWSYFDHVAGRAIRFVNAGLELESRRLL